MTKVFAVKNVLSADQDKVKYVKGFKHWLLTAIYKTSCPLAIHVKWPGFPRRSSAPRFPSHSLVPYWPLSLCRVRVPWNTTVKLTIGDCEAQTSLRPCLPAPHPHPATPHARAPWKKRRKKWRKKWSWTVRNKLVAELFLPIQSLKHHSKMVWIFRRKVLISLSFLFIHSLKHHSKMWIFRL